MVVLRRVVAPVLVASLATPATARAGNCTTLEIALQPALADDANNRSPMQIVVWLEDARGTFVDTAFITNAVGRYGIGNRPGRFDFNSGPRWPYGRRITTFPVWAHRHGLTFPDLVFQNRDDDDLSHPSSQSSPDPQFCAPLARAEPEWDTGTCASVGYTDKGEMAGTSNSRYPPRQDIVRMEQDDPAVEMFDMLNSFDIVTGPTPPAGQLANLVYSVPDTVVPGNYTLWVEVSKEFDMNGVYNPQTYPSPDVDWAIYGLPYRGQPSVLYKIDFTLDAARETIARTAEYVGYGDPDGLDGTIRPPDATITANTPGSGSARLQLLSADGEMYRVQLVAKPELDDIAPAEPGNLEVVKVKSSSATLAFTAPGDDGLIGKATRYEIRIRATEAMTEDNVASSQLIGAVVIPDVAGTVQQLALDRLLWETDYSVGIRAVDNCQNIGPLSIVHFRTTEREVGEVDACFVATAAYGTALANEIAPLRGFRDRVMRKTIFGELAVEAYYTFGPALSGLIGESELLRETTRHALGPVVSATRGVDR